MGYGHRRAAFPLKYLSFGKEIINANDFDGISKKDKSIWEKSKKLYDFISTFKKIPLIGEFIFSIFDNFQKIFSFYPKRDLSNPSFQLRQNYSLIRKGWGKSFFEKIKSKKVPLLSTFFIPAFMAEHFGYKGSIYCLICDSDISRAWAPFNPSQSNIKYLVPTERAAQRLSHYGVSFDNIFLTGFPLPQENIGGKDMNILKEDFSNRLLNLDPKKKYFKQYKSLVRSYLGKLPRKSNHPLTIMFAVGGAGAQKEIGLKILKSFKKRIKRKEVRLIFSAGNRKEVNNYFISKIKKEGLAKFLGENIKIVFNKKIESYFSSFNEALRTTDILWTKPSELSFYSALGIPLIIAPPIGSQEEFNKEWLLRSGFGIEQKDPQYANQWLFDWLRKGYFAEMSMEGFIEGKKMGTLNIGEIILREEEKKCSGY
jgi:hypothetical protein